MGERRGRPKQVNEGQETLGEIPQNFAELPGKETLEVAATKAGFGNKETYRQAKTVVENAEPELVAAMDAGTWGILDLLHSTYEASVGAPACVR